MIQFNILVCFNLYGIFSHNLDISSDMVLKLTFNYLKYILICFLSSVKYGLKSLNFPNHMLF